MTKNVTQTKTESPATAPAIPLAARMLQAQIEIGLIERNAVNPYYNSKFTTLTKIMSEAVPVLAANGIYIHQTFGDSPDGSTVAIETIATDVLTGESMRSGMLRLPAGNTAQSSGAAISYGRRFSLLTFLGLATEDDDAETQRVSYEKNKPLSKDQYDEIEKAAETLLTIDGGEEVYHGVIRSLEQGDIKQKHYNSSLAKIKSIFDSLKEKTDLSDGLADDMISDHDDNKVVSGN